MNALPELVPLLKQLRLSGILDSLEARNREAIDRHLAYTDFLGLLVHDEVARREQKKLAQRLCRANFRSQKTLECFDFDRLLGLNRALVHDLATDRFVEEKVAVLIVGPCGTGKSHLAQAVGHLVAERRAAARFTSPAQNARFRRLTRPRRGGGATAKRSPAQSCGIATAPAGAAPLEPRAAGALDPAAFPAARAGLRNSQTSGISPPYRARPVPETVEGG